MARDEAIRARLEHERQTLLGDIEAIDSENQAQQDDYGIGNHVADDASEVFARERNLALRGNAEDLLSQIDTAMQRLEDGSYGTCARCGREIDAERLEARPYAVHCITCQSEIEQQR
jgi:DnaK suppressor protein